MGNYLGICTFAYGLLSDEYRLFSIRHSSRLSAVRDCISLPNHTVWQALWSKLRVASTEKLRLITYELDGATTGSHDVSRAVGAGIAILGMLREGANGDAEGWQAVMGVEGTMIARRIGHVPLLGRPWRGRIDYMESDISLTFAHGIRTIIYSRIYL